jgi:glutamyl-tRNA reductase
MRQREMLEAENLLQEEADAFIAWRESLSAIPTINQLQERANNFREEELKKCKSKLSNANLSDRELEAVERLSRGIVNKLLHGPMAHLRKTESIEGKQATLKELSAMFRLEDEGGNNDDSTSSSTTASSTSSSSSTRVSTRRAATRRQVRR